MRYKHPGSATHANGVYGGVGTRPAHEAWTPKIHDASDPEDQVPASLRKVRLHRTRKRRMESDEAHRTPEFFVMIVCGVFALIAFLIAFGVLNWRLK